MALDDGDGVIDHGVLPGVEHLLEECLAIGEMPVETSFGHSQAYGQRLDVRTLFAIRWKLGGLLGWDDPATGVGSMVPTLRDRLPADLRDASSGPDFHALPFTSLYLLDEEFAAEIANQTHGIPDLCKSSLHGCQQRAGGPWRAQAVHAHLC